MSTDPVRLTQLVKAGGCGSKLAAEQLRSVLAGLPRGDSSAVLFGLDAADDAGAYLVAPDLVLIQTVDFFTPIVDDPYDFGAIAAANSLSDCYALGGKPITALNIVTAPRNMETEVLREILRGGAEKVSEAGAVVIGGHSVADPEPKFGLAVTGTVHPDRLIRNTGAKVGDKLIITKKIGTGIISNSLKNGIGSLAPAVVKEWIASMKTLNRHSAETMSKFGVQACTDITGFGLLTHAINVGGASGVCFEISYSAVPRFDGVEEIAVPCTKGGGERNRAWVKEKVVLDTSISDQQFAVLADPQTSGPLLMAVSPDKADALLAELKNGGAPAAVIGEAVSGPAGTIRVRP